MQEVNQIKCINAAYILSNKNRMLLLYKFLKRYMPC